MSDWLDDPVSGLGQCQVLLTSHGGYLLTEPRRCGRDAASRRGTVELCWQHEHMVRASVLEEEGLRRAQRTQEERERAEAQRIRYGGHAPLVYYGRGQDGTIKIGVSTNLDQRKKNLGIEILATEPGDRDIERARHVQFEYERVSAFEEWFRPSRRLLAHIDRLATAPSLLEEARS